MSSDFTPFFHPLAHVGGPDLIDAALRHGDRAGWGDPAASR